MTIAVSVHLALHSASQESIDSASVSVAHGGPLGTRGRLFTSLRARHFGTLAVG